MIVISIPPCCIVSVVIFQSVVLQSYWEITSDSYLEFIKEYVIGIGPWKDTIVPTHNNYLSVATDLVARAHAHNLQVNINHR